MSRKSRPGSTSTGGDGPGLRLFRRSEASRVLGPHLRAVLWVQGCARGCSGCLVPASWPRRGPRTPVRDVARWLLSLPDIEGVTFTGGEPMGQARALACLVDQVREERDLGVVCYTGYRIEEISTPAKRSLLARVDLLIDGPYQAHLHGDLRWRASSNQRLLALTPRYADALPRGPEEDRGEGLEVMFGANGTFTFTGVPPWPGYVDHLPVGEPAP